MNEQNTMTLAEFLLARIAEDEAQAQALLAAEYRPEYRHSGCAAQTWSNTDYSEEGISLSPERMLAECEARRRIVEEYVEAREGIDETVTLYSGPDSPAWGGGIPSEVQERLDQEEEALGALERVLCLLALPYASHSAFREEWRV